MNQIKRGVYPRQFYGFTYTYIFRFYSKLFTFVTTLFSFGQLNLLKKIEYFLFDTII